MGEAWFGHVMRMRENEFVKRVCERRIEGGDVNKVSEYQMRDLEVAGLNVLKGSASHFLPLQCHCSGASVPVLGRGI